MGQEAACEVRFAGKTSAGKALLETDELIFRGDFRLVVPVNAIRSVTADSETLRISWPAGTADFHLGPVAAKWAHKIQNPRTLVDKLDIKPGMRISLIGMFDPALRAQVEKRADVASEGAPVKESDLIFHAAESIAGLPKFKKIEQYLKRNGGVWVVYPKGRKEITEAAVLEAGRQSGLVDTKVARFSETHTAIKFVIPLTRR
ncbi:MAG: hypothetical protein U0Q18_18855 [Bryobacteraceae bacterium]